MDVKQIGKIGIYLLPAVAAVIIGMSFLDRQPARSQKSIQYDRFIQIVKQGKVEKISLSVDRRKALFTDTSGEKMTVDLPPDDRLMSIITQNVKTENITVIPPDSEPASGLLASLSTPLIVMAVPTLLLAVLIALLYRRGSKKSPNSDSESRS